MRIHPRVLQYGWPLGDSTYLSLYLVEGERRALIDTGFPDTVRDLDAYLQHFGLSVADVDLILITHGHTDHFLGNPAAQALSNAPVHVHEDDVVLLEKYGEQVFDSYVAPVMRLMGRGERVETERVRWATTPYHRTDRPLKDGDVIDLGQGVELRVVHIPGHSLGSVGYFWEAEGILFCGDALQGQGAMIGSIPNLCDPRLYGPTVDRLIPMPIRLLGMAHPYAGLSGAPSPYSMMRGRSVLPFLLECREVHNDIVEEMARAMHRHSGEPFPRVMAAALEGLSRKMYLRPSPSTGLPPLAEETLGLYYLWLSGQ